MMLQALQTVCLQILTHFLLRGELENLAIKEE